MNSLKMGIVQSYYQKFLNLFIKLEINSKIDDWRLLSANILLTEKDLQKIGF